MNKEEMLLKNFTILSKDIEKNKDALLSAIQQLIEMNPTLGIKVWENVIKENIDAISVDFGKESFNYHNVGATIVGNFEYMICDNRYFVDALSVYAKNKYLLDVIYTKSPLKEYFSGVYAISYLIRKDRLQEAENILSAVYKNKAYTAYAKLWDRIINYFEYGDSYNPGAYFSQSVIQPEHIRDFCIAWIERIVDEEEQAGAMTFAMKLF